MPEENAIPDYQSFKPTPIEGLGIEVGLTGNDTKSFFREELNRRGFAEGMTIDPLVFAEIQAMNEERRFRLFEEKRKAEEERKEKQKRDRFLMRLKIWLPIGTFVASALGIGGYTVAKPDPNKIDAEDVSNDVKNVDTRIIDNAKATKVNSENIQTVAELLVEQQELTVETAGYIGKKIDAAHPRTKDDVEKPPELQNAEDDVEKRKRESKAGKLLKKMPDPTE